MICLKNVQSLLLLFLSVKTSKLESLHPTLFFSADDLPSLRLKSITSHRKISLIIDNAGAKLRASPSSYLPPESFEMFSKNWNERYGNSLCTFSLYCVLHPEDESTLALIKIYMDRMASYPDWYVTDSRGKDQVPIGHSLTGFAIAFDFLYNQFEQERKKKYLKKIKAETAHMYSFVRMGYGGWPKEHIHNHAPTNLVAILLGALVAEVHDISEAQLWKKQARRLLEEGMLMLRLISDGSNNEGVAYGTYAARGWTQYLFLAKRHLGLDHKNHPWLRNQFWFYYATLLPGYDRTVGIADSNYNWFHGPNSQLVFLDSFVMRNGYGNWLADRIREKRNDTLYYPDSTHELSTIYSEFIFYDETIKPNPPPKQHLLHAFHDWGVVTYGGGQSLKAGNTFLSFKSGSVNGEAMADVIEQRILPNVVKSWDNLNGGHEHPDQNSFVFVSNGRYFITEALYGPKVSYLNNVLAFAPSENALCGAPWEGQLGECNKWLNYAQVPVIRGKVVTSTNAGSIVHVAGEAVEAYRAELGLESVQRSLVLLDPELLIVIDSIYLNENSKLEATSAFFHNIKLPFKPTRYLGYEGAEITHPDGAYRFVWFQPDGNSPEATFHDEVIRTEAAPRTTHYVNVTYPLRHDRGTHMTYIFFGPHCKISEVKFLKSSHEEAVRLLIKFNNVTYSLTSVSLMTSLKRRMQILGFGGYLKLKIGEKTHLLGMEEKRNIADKRLPSNFTNLFISPLKSEDKSTPKSANVVTQSNNDCCFVYVFFSVNIVLFLCGLKCWKRQFRRNLILWLVVIAILYIYMMRNYLKPSLYTLNLDASLTKQRNFNFHTYFFPRNIPISHSPTIIIASLPGFGGEILATVFQNSSDFVHLSTLDLTIPVNENSNKFNPCYWPEISIQEQTVTTGWFLTMKKEPLSFLNNLPENNAKVNYARRRFRELHKAACFSLSLLSGFWSSKLSWIHRILENDMRTIYVIRDPRDWIYSLIREDLTKEQKKIQQQLLHNFINPDPCTLPSRLAQSYRTTSDRANYKSVIEQLSRIWRADVKTVVANSPFLQIIRFEDILSDPEHTATELLKTYEITISLPQLNRISRAAHSGMYSLLYEGPIHQYYPGQWKGKIDKNQVDLIESLCGDLMKEFIYL